MRMMKRLMAAFAAVLLASCASMSGPSPEVRHALAPTGKLRVGLFQGSPSHAFKDAKTGEWKGVGHDLGRDLAARLGVPFEPVLYPTPVRFLDGSKKGEYDIAFIAINPERRAYLDFAARHVDIDFGYLVPAGSPIRTIADVDRPGVRVIVAERGAPDNFLSGALKNATLVRLKSVAEMVAALGAGKGDVVGSVKGNLPDQAAQMPGSRILDGAPGAEQSALAMPKGRGEAALAYTRQFIREAKADGRVQAAVDRAGLRGASIAKED